MRIEPHGQSGFSLALTMAVTVVLVLLAAAIFADILDTQRGSVQSRRQANSINAADVGLRMAEAEIYRGLDRLSYSAWSATMSATSPITDSSGSAPDDAPAPKWLPVHELELIGNVRNWPAFCDWGYYISHGGGYTFSTMSAVPGLNPPDVSAQNNDGSAWLETDATPAVPFNEDDPCLTRGWWLVPRDDAPDDDYYPAPATCQGTDSYAVSPAFPVAMSAFFPDSPPSPVTFTATYDGNPYTIGGIQTVPHDYWYTAPQVGICAATASTTSIPMFAKWPNAQAGEYGTGACGMMHGYFTETGATASPGANPPPQIFDTPVYKKIYTLQSGQEVAVYCRMSPYFYFQPSAAAYAHGGAWPYGGTATGGMRSSSNTLDFFLAAVPEGRVDITGNGTAAYRPGNMSSKYVEFNLGGAEVAELATSSDDLASDDGEIDLHDFAPTLDSNLESLTSTLPNYPRDLTGHKFRGDGNLGFNWTSCPASGNYPIAEERMVDVWEEQPNTVPASYDFYFLGVAGTWISQYSSPPWNGSEKGWIIKRYPWAPGGAEGVGEPDSGSYLGQSSASLQCNAEGSFSAIVDSEGDFALSAASGDQTDPATLSDINGNLQYDQWTGPVAGATYSTAWCNLGYRPSLPFSAATNSIAR